MIMSSESIGKLLRDALTLSDGGSIHFIGIFSTDAIASIS